MYKVEYKDRGFTQTYASNIKSKTDATRIRGIVIKGMTAKDAKNVKVTKG